MSDRVTYHHLRIGKAAITFAMRIVDVGENGTKRKWVQYSYSLCSPKDQFNKFKGRNLSATRLHHPKQKRVSGFEIPADYWPEKKVPLYVMVVNHFYESCVAKQPWIRECLWLSKIVSRLKKRDDKKGLIIFVGMPIDAGEHLSNVMKTKAWQASSVQQTHSTI